MVSSFKIEKMVFAELSSQFIEQDIVSSSGSFAVIVKYTLNSFGLVLYEITRLGGLLPLITLTMKDEVPYKP